MKKNINTPLRFGKKGIILVYFLVLLNIVSTITMNYLGSILNNIKMQEKIDEFRNFAFVEVLTIKHIAQAFIDYEEEDETIHFDDFVIVIEYDNLVAYITIENEETGNSRTRTLVFDDLEEMIEEYR